MSVTLKVSGMKCGGCVNNARRALDGLAGLTSADIDLAQATAVLEGDIDIEAAIRRLSEAGYPAERLA